MSEKSRIEAIDTPMAEAVRETRESESAAVGGKIDTREKATFVTNNSSAAVGNRDTEGL